MYVKCCLFFQAPVIMERKELRDNLPVSNLSPYRVSPKTMKLVFVASPISTQH